LPDYLREPERLVHRAAVGKSRRRRGARHPGRQRPRSKTTKNRLHFDLRPKDQAEQIGRLVDLGASRVDIGQSDEVTWVVMADPEGNAICVLAPRPDTYPS